MTPTGLLSHSPLFSFGPLPTFITLLVLLMTFLVFKIVIRPLLEMRFYQKQELRRVYFPLIRDIYNKTKALQKHDDLLYESKFGVKTVKNRGCVTNIGSDACVFLYDVALIREFFLHPENYNRPKDFLDVIGILEGKGVFIVEGSQWKSQRKILSGSFNFDFLKSILGEIQEISKRAFTDLQKNSVEEINSVEVFQQITAEVMGTAFFGEKVNDYKLDKGETLTRNLADIP